MVYRLFARGGRSYPTKSPHSLFVSSVGGVKTVSPVLLCGRWEQEQRGKLLRLVEKPQRPLRLPSVGP